MKPDGKISSRRSPSANGRPNGTTSVWARSRSPNGPEQRERRLRGENLTAAAADVRQRAPPAGPQDRRVRQKDQIAAGGGVAGHHRPGQPDAGAVDERASDFSGGWPWTGVGRTFAGSSGRHYMLLGAERDL